MSLATNATLFVSTFWLVTSNLSTITKKFIDDHYSAETPLVIVANFANLDSQLTDLTTTHRPKILINPQFRQFLPYDNYIIIGDASKTPTLNWNSRGKFLVILPKPATQSELRKIFAELWQRNVYNVAVLTTRGVVTWYPYSRASKCGEFVETVTDATGDVFAGKTTNLGGCPLRILWSPMGLAVTNAFDDDPGFAIVAINNIAKYWNFTPNYMRNNTDFTTKLIQNGGPEELVETIKRDRIDLVVMTLSFGMTLPGLEGSTALWRTNGFFVLPPRSPIRDGSSLYQIFPVSSWSLFLATAIVMVVTWKLLFSDSVSDSIFTVTRLTLQCMVVAVKPRRISSRIAVFFFVLYSTIFSAIYVSQLSSVLTQPSYEPKINTIADLAKTKIPLKFYKATALSLIARSADLYNSIIKQWKDPGQARTMQLLGEFLTKPDHGIVLTETHLSYLKNPNTLETVPDNIETFVINFNLRPGLPLLDRLDWWILETREKGLLLKWVRDASVNIKKFVVATEELGNVPLNIRHVFGAFVVLVAGSSIAIVTLIAEVMFTKFSK